MGRDGKFLRGTKSALCLPSQERLVSWAWRSLSNPNGAGLPAIRSFYSLGGLRAARQSIQVELTPKQRGHLTLERAFNSTRFPFGLFQKNPIHGQCRNAGSFIHASNAWLANGWRAREKIHREFLRAGKGWDRCLMCSGITVMATHCGKCIGKSERQTPAHDCEGN